MSLDDVVSVVISANSRTPTRQGFGNALLLAYHTVGTELYRVYEDTADMLTDGFSATGRAYLMAQAAFAQNPRPPKVLIGRLATPSAQSLTVTVTSATEGDVVSVEVRAVDTGSWVPCTYTVGAAETTTTVATALELLIEAVNGVTSSSAAAVVTATPTVAGAFTGLRNPQNCWIKDNSTDTGYVTALGNILAQTTDFYFVCTDHNSETIADLVAAWAQSNKKIYWTQTNDTIEARASGDGGTFGSGQKAASYTYSAGLFVYDPTEYGAVAAAALGAVRDPGSFSWSFKELLGITTVALTATQEGYLKTNGWNYYQEVANGLNGIWGLYGGGAAFGGRFLDLTHGTDALVARLQESIAGVLASADKVDYTEPGVLLLVAQMKAILRQFEDSRLLVKGSSVVTYGAIADQLLADRVARYYPSLKFAATYAGAIHRARIVGTIAN